MLANAVSSSSLFPKTVSNLPWQFYKETVKTECGKIRTRKTPNTDTFH